jgi:AcrR family transcriptional regulator
MDDNKYSLRERKYAKTKIGLANAFMERLKTTRFSDIPIKDVCYSVEVSEGTFYNYFPQKVDVVYYAKSLVGLKIAWEIRLKEGELSSLQLIESALDLIAQEMQPPYLFYEMISIFTGEQRKPETMTLSVLEKEYAYPDCEGIGGVEIGDIEDLFSALIKTAQDQYEINGDIDVKELLLLLMTVMIGVPLAINIDDFKNINKYYQNQLSLLGKAIEAGQK